MSGQTIAPFCPQHFAFPIRKTAGREVAAGKCESQHPLDRWRFPIGVLGGSPLLQRQIFPPFTIVILINISGMELNKIDSNCCVCHTND